MTLHEAIEQVLRESRKPMKATEIAQIINESKLYIKGDNTLVGTNQISARISKYQNIFKVDAQGISLHDISIKPYRDFMLRLTDLLNKIAPASPTNINDFVASFLMLIYYKGHETRIQPNQIYSPKGFLISLFQNIENEHLKLESLFIPTTDFISSSLSEFNTEQILNLVANYRFSELQRPSQEEFSNFFNDTINLFSWKNNFSGGHISTPRLVSLLMCSLYELPREARIFDPFAGRASLLAQLIHTHKDRVYEVFAGDISQSSLISGSLNLYATGLKHFDYKQRNAFEDWEGTVNADLIISNPPFGGRFDNLAHHSNWHIVPSADVSVNAIQMTLHHLNPNGKAVLVLPESILFSFQKGASLIRQFLVEQDLLNAVILLPKNSFKPYASVSTVVVILDKSKRSKSTGIFFYDASSIPLSEFQSEIGTIVTSFHSETTKRDKARWVNKSEIESNSFDLTVKPYLLQSFEDHESISLRNLISESFTGSHIPADYINKTEGTPYIQVGDLADSEGLEVLSLKKVKSYILNSEIVNFSFKEIKPGSVLISKVGTKLKPTLFDNNFKALASSNIIVLYPNNNVSAEYLVSQLQSDYVQKQIEAIRRYNAIPNFNLKDLLEIKIKKLSYEKQQQYVASYYSRKISDIERAETKSKEDELYNLISRIKHEVKQPVSSIGIDISILIDYLQQKEKENKPISMNDYAIEPLPGQKESDLNMTKVVNILTRIRSSVDEAQETLHKAEETLNIGKGSLKLETIEIRQYIESIIKPLYVNANCSIEVSGKEFSIKADKYQLKVLFRHLIDNAINHGFIPDRQRKNNVVRIELTKDSQRSFVEIVVMNNGQPFSKGFNKTLFETKGRTNNRDSGSGFGGYHIKRIIENHRGEFQIADEEEVQFSDFKVKFKIYLPLNIT
jgi:type I restriction enzyme M protein